MFILADSAVFWGTTPNNNAPTVKADKSFFIKTSCVINIGGYLLSFSLFFVKKREKERSKEKETKNFNKDILISNVKMFSLLKVL